MNSCAAKLGFRFEDVARSPIKFDTGCAKEKTKKKGKWGLGGAAAGAALGQMLIPIPGVGALIGAGLGSMVGQFAGGRQIGTMNATGKPFEPVTRKLVFFER